MKKFISAAVAVAMALSLVPVFNVAFAEETVVSAVRTMYFNNSSECKETDGDNILIASNGSDGWQCATSFTDEDGTQTSQSSLSGTGFATPRNAVVAFELPDIDYSKLVSATFSITVKNVKQVTANERIGVYANSLEGAWTVGTDARDALGFGGPETLGLEMLGFTTAIATGNQTGESESNETITLSSQKLVSYIKQLYEEGYSEVTLRLANSLGGIRFYDANQTNKPTLTLETGEVASITIKSVLENGESFGVEDKTVNAVSGKEYSYAAPSSVMELDGDYYIFNEELSTLTITPTAGEDNVITLVYSKFDGTGITGDVITDEGATCWFADPRSLTVKSDDQSVNRTYIGYIDVHGSVKATQYDNITGEVSEVLVRSNFQPDDHNNPTFLELPDHRIMIFYSRHTDEACFYYRISKQPYDITTLGEEKHLATSNNTTYPSPFILSDDPDYIYLCWRGINWHPTIGKISMPDENDEVELLLEKQIVQSTGARPYAKYTSNGKDEIWVTYTTGHPDNEDPNWLYFNRINVTTMDVMNIKGEVLSNIESGVLNVNKTSACPDCVVSNPSAGTRNWVWEITIDENGTPVIAMVKIDSGKTNHNYYCATYDAQSDAWVQTFLTYAGGKFHSSSTEYCYSGGMTIDKADPHVFYCSVPVDGVFGEVFEIVKYTLNDDYTEIESTEYITENSMENNVRPYIANGSEEGDMRLTWMNGYYQYWMVRDSYPDGFPTKMMTSFDIPEQEIVNSLGENNSSVYAISDNSVEVAAPSSDAFTISMEILQSDISVGGTLLESGNLKIDLEKQTVDPNKDYDAVAPNVTAGDKSQKSDNLFSNSDWFTSVSGTNGDKGVNSMGWINYTVTYDGTDLVTYVNGLIDANLQDVSVSLTDVLTLGGISGIIANVRTADVALTQAEVKADAETFDSTDINIADTIDLGDTDNVISDLVLPSSTADGQSITWSSSDEAVIDSTGALTRDGESHSVVLTATVGTDTKEFTITVPAKESVYENLIFSYDFSETYTATDGTTMVKDTSGNGMDAQLYGTAAVLDAGKLDLTANTASGWDTNSYMNVPYDFLDGVRSYSVVQKVQAGDSTHPRFYDFGTNNQNSVFTRVDALSAGIKNSSTLLENSSSSVSTSDEQWLVTTYSAATGITTIYLDGEAVASGTTITHEAYTAAGGTDRNYIGRTQWWDYGSYGADNQDFDGTIDNFMFFNTALSEDEIAQVTSTTIEAESALRIITSEGTVSLGLAYTATVSGITDNITAAGFEYGAFEADADGNYTVLDSEGLIDKSFDGFESTTFRLSVSGISNANSARVYAARPYVVADGEKIYGEFVTATLYGQIVDSIVNGEGTTILPERLAAANNIIAFVKANRNENSEARFPGLADATAALYTDGEIIAKAAAYGITDDASAIVAENAAVALEAVDIEFVSETMEEVEIVNDLTVELDFTEVM